MKIAAEAWNLVSPGGVRFEESDEDNAHFHVRYHPRRQRLRVMSAFFPGTYIQGDESLSEVIVFPPALDRTDTAHIFLHELGHVLGFRHSFALTQERDQLGGTFREENKTSVMSYMSDPKINARDVADSREVYDRMIDGADVSLKTGQHSIARIFKVTRLDP